MKIHHVLQYSGSILEQPRSPVLLHIRENQIFVEQLSQRQQVKMLHFHYQGKIFDQKIDSFAYDKLLTILESKSELYALISTWTKFQLECDMACRTIKEIKNPSNSQLSRSNEFFINCEGVIWKQCFIVEFLKNFRLEFTNQSMHMNWKHSHSA